MLLFNRRILLMIPLALAACGFEPVYGPGTTATALQGQVLVDEPANRDSYLLVQQLEERLDRAGPAAKYGLSVNIRTRTLGQAVTEEGDITRYALEGRASYVLKDRGTGAVIYKGSVENFTGYSATDTTTDELASQRDARRRLMVILADQIVQELQTRVDLSS